MKIPGSDFALRRINRERKDPKDLTNAPDNFASETSWYKTQLHDDENGSRGPTARTRSMTKDPALRYLETENISKRDARLVCSWRRICTRSKSHAREFGFIRRRWGHPQHQWTLDGLDDSVVNNGRKFIQKDEQLFICEKVSLRILVVQDSRKGCLEMMNDQLPKPVIVCGQCS
ncbi:hypothetical protein BCR34DRAFT_591272 [Clohesyomyces aquaticus]|uniref:Uncharacterized protein n=1 Tax=Clohesyomyces aquaticus TaxID=1231657 RepID=A0A1Y1Z2C9_9PLEO|nr:hypothetical protein BCR34DRAFT_591272 [Clohesyomyces aquaticus]